MNIAPNPFPTSQSEQQLLDQIAIIQADYEKQIKPLMDALVRYRSIAQSQHYVERAEWLASHIVENQPSEKL